jgi:hypothetical protein
MTIHQHYKDKKHKYTHTRKKKPISNVTNAIFEKKNRGSREIRTTLRRTNAAQLKETRRVFEAIERQDKTVRQKGGADPFLDGLKGQLASLEHRRAATEAHVCCEVRAVFSRVSSYLSNAQCMVQSMSDHSQMPVETLVGKNEGHTQTETDKDKMVAEGHTQTDKLQMSVGLSQTDAPNEARARNIAHAATSTSQALDAAHFPARENDSASACSDGDVHNHNNNNNNDNNNSVNGRRGGDANLEALAANERILREQSECEAAQLKLLLEKEREKRHLLESQVCYCRNFFLYVCMYHNACVHVCDLCM